MDSFSIPFFAVTGLLGLIAYKLDPTMNANQALPNAVKMILPVGLKGLVIAGVISIIMSSADSFLNSAAVGFTHDVVKPLWGEGMTNRRELVCAQAVNLITGVLAVLFAMSIPNLIDLLIFAYTFWAPVILVPLALAILGVKGSRRACFAAFISGIAGTMIWRYGLGTPGGFDAILIGVLANFAVFMGVRSFDAGVSAEAS